ncbi:hypothetical protein, partial [Pseudomonas fluorescens]
MGQQTMKYLQGLDTLPRAGPMELFYPAKARLPTHKQRHHVHDCDRDLAVGTSDLARVRSP